MRVRRDVSIFENQFVFLPRLSTTKAIHLVRRLVKKYWERKSDLHVVFIDFEKAYDKVLERIHLEMLGSRGVPVAYIRAIKDVYDGAKTRVRTMRRDLEHFPVELGLHQGSVQVAGITTVISDLDLKNLIDVVNKKFQANEKWEDVINRRTDRFSYCAQCCKLKDAPLKYLSVTVFENCSVEMIRDFYMDNDFRKIWDKTLIEHKQLQVDSSSGTETGLMIKKFPLLTPREYILAWRVWEGNDGSFYCFTKECEYPLAQRRKKYVRVRLFRSGWRIKKVSGRNACEIQMVHQEDAGLNVEMAKLAFAKGIWSYVCKMDDALRQYVDHHSQLTSGVNAVTLIQKVPLGLDTLDHTRGLINPEICTSSDYCGGVSHECNAREQRKEPSNNLVPNMLMLLGGAICMSRGLSNLGSKVAMACILSKLVKLNGMRSKNLQRFSQIEVQTRVECDDK
ncbi:hypothetical protein MTR67_015995 [Solanum verrucosum]|uniref:START domain-containing protein n=1 Tax=Solanum verrucosum TaxID=315347 RepID=A0AAF0QHV3_SOLVR|nr:hypothetical protein MTR67_015995 [Solanum verrucosum]